MVKMCYVLRSFFNFGCKIGVARAENQKKYLKQLSDKVKKTFFTLKQIFF